jgi:hypothetical protein
MRDVGHRPTRPRLVVVAKIDTPPGPTKNPTTIRTMPKSTCPWKSWTIPAITRTTAMTHKMVAMARYYPAAITRILVAARSVAVATHVVTVEHARTQSEAIGAVSHRSRRQLDTGPADRTVERVHAIYA